MDDLTFFERRVHDRFVHVLPLIGIFVLHYDDVERGGQTAQHTPQAYRKVAPRSAERG